MVKFDDLVKSHETDDTVKSFRCKAHKSLGTRRTKVYVGVTKDEVQRSIWAFYEVVKFRNHDGLP